MLLCGFLKLIGPLYLILPGIMAYFLFKHGAIVPSSAAVVDETTGLLTEANAYGELVRTVLPPWLAGFFAAAMIGAVLSSFNSALNSTCTLFSLGIYRKLFPEAGEARAVVAGKRFGAVLAIAAMSFSPLLDSVPSIFGYLQKMNSIYFIPILAVVLLGLVSRRAKQATAVAGMLLGAAAIACGHFVLPLLGGKWDVVARIGEYNFVALVFLAVFDLMLVWRLVSPSGKAHEFQDAKAVNLTPWGGAKWASLAMLAVIVAIYAHFADFAPLRIAGDIPWESFAAKWLAAVLPTVLLLWLDRRCE